MKTIRQDIMEVLRTRPSSVRDISKLLSIREKEAYEHLEHIEKSLHGTEKLMVESSTCLSCGFVFKKRTRLTMPGRCPVCRKEHITRPLFWIDSKS
jgi:predicted Zn-ribbon and HTH transcriptional regulator